jgi:hypothetical protein
MPALQQQRLSSCKSKDNQGLDMEKYELGKIQEEMR